VPITPHALAAFPMPPATPRLDALTGLRFLAAAAVFVYHLPGWLPMPGFNPGPLGKAAVGYFFVLSGFIFFVLSGFILAHVHGRGDGSTVAHFYLARFARIWPLHAVCLLAMLAIVPATVPDTAREWLQLAVHALLLQGWSTSTEWSLAWNGPAWTLSVEAFFYALFPLLIRWRTRTLWCVYGACWLANVGLYALAEAAVQRDPSTQSAWANLTGSFPLPRLQEFVLGMLAHGLWARWRERPPRSVALATLGEVLAVAAAAGAFFACAGGQWGPAWLAGQVGPITLQALAQGPGMSLAFAATIVLCANGRGLVARGLSHPALVHLGEISYAFYLVHTPVMAVVGVAMQPYAFAWQVPAIAGFATTIAIAALLHALVEKPARQALLAPAARGRVFVATAAAGLRTRALWRCVLLGGAGFALTRLSPPDVATFAATIASDGVPTLRSVRCGERAEVAGALLFPHGGGLVCWIAWRDDTSAPTDVVVEARRANGELVATLTTRTQSTSVPDGRRTSVATADAPLGALIGATLLTLRLCDATGTTLSANVPPSGPYGLELLRLP
jgi:peptidoglycan/LPS O-acetylase OafA/YrhL